MTALSNRERSLVKAYGKGRTAAELDRLRSENPYQPSNADHYAAWLCGYDEDNPVYRTAA